MEEIKTAIKTHTKDWRLLDQDRHVHILGPGLKASMRRPLQLKQTYPMPGNLMFQSEDFTLTHSEAGWGLSISSDEASMTATLPDDIARQLLGCIKDDMQPDDRERLTGFLKGV